MRRQAGQAGVELVACAFILALVAVAAVTALSAIRARIAAERLADQAAVLVAEGRPLPAELRTRARIELDGRSVEVTVPLAVSVPGLPAAATASASIPR